MEETGPSMTRRDALSWMALPFTTALMLGFTRGEANTAEIGGPGPEDHPHAVDLHAHQGGTMEVYYLEIVTTDVDATCGLYAQMYGLELGDADPSLGGARTAAIIYQAGIESGLWQV